MGTRKPKHVPPASKPRVPRSSRGGRALLSKPTDLKTRFSLFVDSRNSRGCHPWLGVLRDDGYGRIKVDGKRKAAHRVAYELAYGPPEPGAVIRHICNNRWCVNPKHLRSGTHADNQRDKVVSGRQARGERNGRAKLTDNIARSAIRRMMNGERKTDLAREYGVSRRALRYLETRKNWAHVHARPEQTTLGSVVA